MVETEATPYKLLERILMDASDFDLSLDPQSSRLHSLAVSRVM